MFFGKIIAHFLIYIFGQEIDMLCLLRNAQIPCKETSNCSWVKYTQIAVWAVQELCIQDNTFLGRQHNSGCFYVFLMNLADFLMICCSKRHLRKEGFFRNYCVNMIDTLQCHYVLSSTRNIYHIQKYSVKEVASLKFRYAFACSMCAFFNAYYQLYMKS